MTKKEFLNAVCNGKQDILEIILNTLEQNKIDCCLIGGLAVNAYVEPVVSLDVDIIIEIATTVKFLEALKDFKIEKFPHRLNISSSDSDLRIQIQTDVRYQEFLNRYSKKNVMGYEINVASIEDVLQGKIWAYMDKERRESKRQKDLADILRIIEKYDVLKISLPELIKEKIKL